LDLFGLLPAQRAAWASVVLDVDDDRAGGDVADLLSSPGRVSGAQPATL
jgi:hypothetical protein